MRPKVICHIMSSVDGRLVNNRWTKPFNGKSQSDLIAEYAKAGLELGTDAWMFGLTTAREGSLPYKYVSKKINHELPRIPYHGHRVSVRMFIVSDPDGSIYYNTDKVRGDNIIAIISEKVCDEYLQHLQEAGISYVFAGDDGHDLNHALDAIGNEFGITSISLQGGGIMNGAFLKAGLIDEISIAIYPGIDGLSGIPSIFESMGSHDSQPADGQTLELTSAKQLAEGVVWLRYKVHKTND